MSELEDILEEGKCIPIHLERFNKLEECIKEAKSWISDVEKFLEVIAFIITTRAQRFLRSLCGANRHRR